MRNLQNIRIEPTTLDGILRVLRRRASKKQAPVIVQAQLAVTPESEHLLDYSLSQPMETIRY